MVYGLSMEPFLSFGETVDIVQCDGPLKKGIAMRLLRETH